MGVMEQAVRAGVIEIKEIVSPVFKIKSGANIIVPTLHFAVLSPKNQLQKSASKIAIEQKRKRTSKRGSECDRAIQVPQIC